MLWLRFDLIQRYHIDYRQPTDVIETFRDFFTKEGLKIDYGALLHGGAVICMSAFLKGADEIGSGDIIRHYITLSAGFDKQHGTQATVGNIRTVGTTTLRSDLGESVKAGPSKRTKINEDNSIELPNLVSRAQKYAVDIFL